METVPIHFLYLNKETLFDNWFFSYQARSEIYPLPPPSLVGIAFQNPQLLNRRIVFESNTGKVIATTFSHNFPHSLLGGHIFLF